VCFIAGIGSFAEPVFSWSYHRFEIDKKLGNFISSIANCAVEYLRKSLGAIR
jgi:hypothetical protein